MLTRGSVYWAFGQAQSQDAAVFNLEYRSGAARSAATVNRDTRGDIFPEKSPESALASTSRAKSRALPGWLAARAIGLNEWCSERPCAAMLI